MKKEFMWYYSLFITGYLTAYAVWLLFTDGSGFELFVMMAPIAVWLINSRERTKKE